MNNDFLLLFLYIGGIFLSGYCFILGFFKEIVKKQTIFTNSALSWFVGSYIFIFGLYLLTFFNKLNIIVKGNFIYFLLTLFVLSIIVTIRRWRYLTPRLTINIVIFILFIIFFIPLIKDALFSYLIGWDAIGIWMLKAKVFFFNSGFWNNSFFMEKGAFFYANKSYPLGIPLLISGYYHLIGSVNDQMAQFILLMFYLNMVIMSYGMIRKIFPTFSHFFSFLIILSISLLPNFIIYSHNGYVDMILGAVFLAQTILFIIFFDEEDQNLKLKYAALLFIIGALGATIKNEGYTFWATASILTFILYKEKKRFINLFVLLFLALIPILLWEYVKKTYHLSISYYFENAGIQIQNLSRLKPIVFQYLDELMSVSKYGILLLSFFFIFIFQSTVLIFKKKFMTLIPLLLIILQLSFYSLIFFIAAVPIDWQVKALDRLSLHVLPSFFILILYLLKEKVTYEKT